ncbi:UNVERIFIED_CONTAM: hypothetical protein Slati_2121800 [Sesamum latifolium]|uniref:Myb/SANT-like domain-containing protein n=1 Tax=Sesamum latifolium TaxID=2727402 RepID=A0AAW2WRT7_9LAMI
MSSHGRLYQNKFSSSNPSACPTYNTIFTGVESCGSNDDILRLKRKVTTPDKVSSLLPKEWSNIFSGVELYERNKTQYTIVQLKGKANRLRMLWRKFYDLVYKRTGFGWDPSTYTVTASEDRWAEWVAANTRESGLRKKGLPHFNLCTEMFSASVATGNIARSSAIPPLDTNADDELDEHQEECNGKGGQSGHSNKTNTCIDAITACSEAKTRKLEKNSNNDIEDCMFTLSKMEGLPRELFFAAQDQFMLKVRRQMFLLMTDAEKRAWIERLGKISQMDESSGNTTSSPPSRSNSPHDIGLSGSSGGDEDTDSSNMSSDEEKHFILHYELLCPSYFRTKQPQHTSSLQGSNWVSELMSGCSIRVATVACLYYGIGGHFLANCWSKRASENELRAFPAFLRDHFQAYETCLSGSESSCTGANLPY